MAFIKEKRKGLLSKKAVPSRWKALPIVQGRGVARELQVAV